jgi:hypothetical protein
MTDSMPEPIKLTTIDADNLSDIDDVPEAIAFRVGLSKPPSETWRAEFDAAFHGMHHPIKPMTVLEEQSLFIAFLPRYSKDLQDFFDFLGRVVDRASNEEAKTIEIHHREGRLEPKRRFQEVLRRIKVPT